MTDLVVAGDSSVLRSAVERARAGDQEAFGWLVDRRIDAMYRTALAILRDESDARDAVQDTLIGAWRDLPSLRQIDRFDAWLGRSLVNRCRTSLRARRRRRVREIKPGDEGLSAHPHSDLALDDSVTDVDAIRRAFARLSADHRAVIVLHHVERRQITEIAEMLGVPAGTVKWRLHEARRALERALAGENR